MATGTLGTATIFVRINLQQYARDMARLRQLTVQAANSAGNSFRRIEQHTKRTSIGVQALSRQFLVLRAAIAGVASVSGIRVITAAADAWVNMSARLQQVTRSAGETAAVQERLFRIAQNSRAELEGVVNLYTKLKISSDELGISQEQAFRFTENFSKALALSGVDAVRAAQVSYQLTQSFTKQRLEGDELRTVYEAFPMLLRLIANEQGTTAEAIINDSKQSGIAVTDLISAVVNGTDEINSRFGKLPVTIGQSLTKVSNAFIRATGLSATNSGAFKDLTDALQELSDVISGENFATV